MQPFGAETCGVRSNNYLIKSRGYSNRCRAFVIDRRPVKGCYCNTDVPLGSLRSSSAAAISSSACREARLCPRQMEASDSSRALPKGNSSSPLSRETTKRIQRIGYAPKSRFLRGVRRKVNDSKDPSLDRCSNVRSDTENHGIFAAGEKANRGKNEVGSSRKKDARNSNVRCQTASRGISAPNSNISSNVRCQTASRGISAPNSNICSNVRCQTASREISAPNSNICSNLRCQTANRETLAADKDARNLDVCSNVRSQTATRRICASNLHRRSYSRCQAANHGKLAPNSNRYSNLRSQTANRGIFAVDKDVKNLDVCSNVRSQTASRRICAPNSNRRSYSRCQTANHGKLAPNSKRRSNIRSQTSHKTFADGRHIVVVNHIMVDEKNAKNKIVHAVENFESSFASTSTFSTKGEGEGDSLVNDEPSSKKGKAIEVPRRKLIESKPLARKTIPSKKLSSKSKKEDSTGSMSSASQKFARPISEKCLCCTMENGARFNEDSTSALESATSSTDKMMKDLGRFREENYFYTHGSSDILSSKRSNLFESCFDCDKDTTICSALPGSGSQNERISESSKCRDYRKRPNVNYKMRRYRHCPLTGHLTSLDVSKKISLPVNSLALAYQKERVN